MTEKYINFRILWYIGNKKNKDSSITHSFTMGWWTFIIIPKTTHLLSPETSCIAMESVYGIIMLSVALLPNHVIMFIKITHTIRASAPISNKTPLWIAGFSNISTAIHPFFIILQFNVYLISLPLFFNIFTTL